MTVLTRGFVDASTFERRRCCLDKNALSFPLISFAGNTAAHMRHAIKATPH